MNLRLQASNFPGVSGTVWTSALPDALSGAPVRTSAPPPVFRRRRAVRLQPPLHRARTHQKAADGQRVRDVHQRDRLSPLTRTVYVGNPADAPTGSVQAWPRRLPRAPTLPAGTRLARMVRAKQAGRLRAHDRGRGRLLRRESFEPALRVQRGQRRSAVESGDRIRGAIYATPTVVNGWVFAGARDNLLHAFSIRRP